MTKRKLTIIIAAAVLLLAATVVSVYAYTAASGGTADDPLITLSELNNTYTPTLLKEGAEMISSEVSASGSTVSIISGESVSLTCGQTVTLFSGSAEFTVSGTVVDTSDGVEIKSGLLKANHLYMACENTKAVVTADSSAVLCVSCGVSSNVPDCPFTDVTLDSWYYDGVFLAYRRGLVNGVTATTYVPSGSLTAAQAVKLAACMHQLYKTGSVTLKNSSDSNWYSSYVQYAKSNGIMSSDFSDYNTPITRGDFIRLFYSALPESCYNEINTIADNSVPDIPVSDSDSGLSQAVYTFYRAGILTGFTKTKGYSEHAFGASADITRAEVAVIMNRMFDETARLSFSIG